MEDKGEWQGIDSIASAHSQKGGINSSIAVGEPPHGPAWAREDRMACRLLGALPFDQAGFGGRLVADFVERFESVRPFFRRNPWEPAAWDAVLKDLASATFPRQAVAEKLQAAAALRGSAPEVLAAIASLRDDRTFVVATGQQAGLLGGPLFTLHKALTAIQLARALTRRFAPAARFVPLFWVAGDDHDLDEIAHLAFIDAQGAPKRIRIPLAERHPGQSAAMANLTAEELERRTDLEKETIAEVRKVLQEEFKKE